MPCVPTPCLCSHRSPSSASSPHSSTSIRYCYFFVGNTWRVVSSTVADPDPNWIQIQSGQSVDPDPGGLKWPTKVEKIKKFHVLEVLDVLGIGELEAEKN
jgi:hypothetical protein